MSSGGAEGEAATGPERATEAFGWSRLTHHQTHSRLVRATWNPLFAVHHEEAILRDLAARLRRRSRLHGRKRRYLAMSLHEPIAYRLPETRPAPRPPELGQHRSQSIPQAKIPRR